MNTPVAPHGEFGRLLLAEWTKFRTVRSSYWIVIITVVITFGLGASLLAGIVAHDDTMTAAQRAGLEPAGTGIWYHGLDLGQAILAVLGVLVATGEYASGTMRVTLAASPRRLRVFAAKTVGFAGLTLLFGAVVAVTAFATAQPILAGHGLSVPLTDPTALRGVGLAALATAGVALLGLGTGLLVRHTAGALTTLLVVLLGVPIVGQFVPDSWQTVIRYLPPEAAWALFTPDHDSLALPAAIGVLAGWVVLVLLAAAITFQRRDV